ncbi:hypothetical protein WN51_00116 [Melipona quadrifasciata]|uniref:Uncharacterized protein n=1 Tax=Melipona quadrifasciata TaxID=166423 RepID=A0A0N0U7P1_9HYME|nr:hypothetical protein WN51_00116 [Melipona quadrifasciata]
MDAMLIVELYALSRDETPPDACVNRQKFNSALEKKKRKAREKIKRLKSARIILEHSKINRLKTKYFLVINTSNFSSKI